MKNYQRSTRLSSLAIRPDSLSKKRQFYGTCKRRRRICGTANDLLWTAEGNYNLWYAPGLCHPQSRAWQVTDGLSSSPFSRDYFWTLSLDLAPLRESKEPFVIPTLNIFLKTRFRPDFTDTHRPGRASERRWSCARKSPLLSLRNEEPGLSNYGRSDINKVLQRSRWFLASDYDSKVYDKLTAVVYMKMVRSNGCVRTEVWFIILYT